MYEVTSMKKFVGQTLIASVAAAALSTTAMAADVTIDIAKASGKAEIYVRLFNDSESDGYPKEAPALQAKIAAGSNSVTFENVAAGKYAVAMFEDENGNGELDKNFVGKPTEPVGYSGDKQFLKPGFDGASFQVGEGHLKVTSTFH
jgi:uncharacterized protein (DUF2141 family)